MLALRGLEFSNCFLLLFEAGYSKIHKLGREIFPEVLETLTRLVILGYAKLIFFYLIKCSSCRCYPWDGEIVLLNQLFEYAIEFFMDYVVYENVDGERVCSVLL